MSTQKTEANYALAQNIQDKFEFYVLSLIFTLLALSIQTAKFGVSIVSDSFELFGWLSLLSSGIIGLWRMELKPNLIAQETHRKNLEEQMFEYKEKALIGHKDILTLEHHKIKTIDEMIDDHKKGISLLKERNKILDSRMNTKYLLHRYSFLLGVVSLVLSRGYIPFISIIHELTK